MKTPPNRVIMFAALLIIVNMTTTVSVGQNSMLIHLNTNPIPIQVLLDDVDSIGYSTDFVGDAFMVGSGVTDLNGYDYPSVVIGNQEWMAENLRTNLYANGDTIHQSLDTLVSVYWQNFVWGAWCYYGFQSEDGDVYGKLYNGYAIADPRGLCPAGWHVPLQTEWQELVDYLGGEDIAGGRLKTIGVTHWAIPNVNASNQSGFNGLPAGAITEDGDCHGLKGIGMWWSFPSVIWNIGHNGQEIAHTSRDEKHGSSVRCVKD